MANVTQISLESLLLRTTNPNNSNVDTAALNAFFALINKERDGASLGVKVIATRLPVGSEKEVLATLNVLDSCMSKCGVNFQNEVGKFRFLNEMIKLVSPKYLGSRTPLSVKQRVLQLLYLWTLDYPKEVKIKEAFDMLRKQGVIREIPNPNIPEEALGYESKKRIGNSIFHDEEKSNILRKLLQSKDPEDIQAANWLIKSMVKEDEKLADLKSKTLTELESVQNNMKLLNEMIGSFREGDTTKNELDLMGELHDNLVRFKPNLKSMASSDESWPVDILESLLKTMDEVSECLNKYSEIVLNSKLDYSKSNLASLLELDQQSVNVGSTSLIHMDQFRESKSSTDDCSCSYNGSSQISQVSSTSKSPVDVLCDVFSGLGSDTSQDSDILKPVAVSNNSENKTKDREKEKDKKFKALEDLDVLSEHLLKENLSLSNYRTQEKIPMNLLTKVNETKKSQNNGHISDSSKLDLNYLLETPKSANPDMIPCSSKSDDNLSQVDSTDDCLVDLTEEKNSVGEKLIEKMQALESNKNDIKRDGNMPVKLKDITIKLEDIKPSSQKSIVALDDKNGLSVLLHKAADAPQASVTVYVVTTISRNELPLSNYLLQAVVPKGCKLRLLPPSSTDLPAFNPFLPPAAITQIMLLANESHQDDICFKFIVSYIMDEDTVTEMGDVQNLPLDTALLES
ncbi:ADP-ribosylation factor-binding protein GGA1 isoform X2 [Euwallacea similis]|uniref:ADP-ribosylation factor-binding protein GGA1 isoform X2 n=1 Tax=Euwallacea similis TaxID=1736056 RepID=UPI00344CE289